MQVDSGDTISIIGATCDTVGTCVATGSGNGAWVALIDARSINSGVTFNAAGYPNFMIENLSKDTTSDIVVIRGSTVLASSSHVDTYTYGNTAGGNPIYPDPTTSTNNRPAALAPGGKYPVPTAPTFANLQASDFVNVKDSATNGGRTVKGDHTIDESGVLNEILQMAAKANKPVFFPFGKYRVDSTLVVPAGSRIVGEGWATITGYGSFFGDESNPKPVVQVGQANEVGVAQIQDMRFTVSQVLPGAIIFQVNMAGSRPGDVALWNSLVTVGGTRGADDLTNQCTDASNECKAAFIGIHATTSSSLYLENVWNWVAVGLQSVGGQKRNADEREQDHITESFSGGSNIAGKGGVLIESTKATWLMGLGSEVRRPVEAWSDGHRADDASPLALVAVPAQPPQRAERVCGHAAVGDELRPGRQHEAGGASAVERRRQGLGRPGLFLVRRRRHALPHGLRQLHQRRQQPLHVRLGLVGLLLRPRLPGLRGQWRVMPGHDALDPGGADEPAGVRAVLQVNVCHPARGEWAEHPRTPELWRDELGRRRHHCGVSGLSGRGDRRKRVSYSQYHAWVDEYCL